MDEFDNATIFAISDDNSTNINASVNSTDGDFEPKPFPWFTFIVEGVLLLIISLIGCVGNVFSVLGLARNKKTRSFTKLLIALAIFDLLYLVMGIAIFGMPALSEWYNQKIYIFIVPVW